MQISSLFEAAAVRGAFGRSVPDDHPVLRACVRLGVVGAFRVAGKVSVWEAEEGAADEIRGALAEAARPRWGYVEIPEALREMADAMDADLMQVVRLWREGKLDLSADRIDPRPGHEAEVWAALGLGDDEP